MKTPRRARSMPDIKSSRELLKAALGRKDATLLDALPIDKIEYAEHGDPKFHNCISHRIRLGSIFDGSGTRLTMWAYLGKEAPKDGLPEVSIYAFHPTDGSSTIRTASVAIADGEIREEFKRAVEGRGSFAIMLKASFILKGAELPSDVMFTDSLLGKLRRICRRYKQQTTGDPNETPSSQGQACEAGFSSPIRPINLKKCMRKTQQRGPPTQMFGALGSALPGTPSSLRKAAGNGAFSSALDDTIEGLEEDDGVEWDGLLDTPSTKPKAAGPWMSKFSESEPPIMNHSVTSDSNKPNLVPNRSLALNAPPKFPDSPSDIPSIRPAIASRQGRSTPTAPASMRSLNEYLALHTKHEELDTAIDTVSSDIKQTISLYHNRRLEMCHYIDKELPQAHSKAVAALRASQAEEVLELKAQYAALKKEQDEETNALKQQQAEQLASKEELRCELAARREEISKEDILDVLIAQHDTNKRKRQDSIDSVQ